jgi:anti-sigma regulatory factor (Ser/Thr protein kinase)
VAEADRLLGIISLEDFIKWLADRAEDCPIENRMTPHLETLCQDDPLVLGVEKFERTGLGRFPVVDRQSGKLVGIVTKGDVIEGLLKRLEVDYHTEELRRHRASHIFEDIEADETTLHFEYGVKGQDFQQAGTSSSRLKRTLKRLGVRPDVVRRVAIASYEAGMNLVIFTQGGTIRARVQPGEIILEVEDSGPGIADIQQALLPGYSTAPDWVREMGFGAGMGLVNIQKSSDEFEITSEPGVGTLLKARFTGNGEKHETGRGGTHTGSGSQVGPPQAG